MTQQQQKIILIRNNETLANKRNAYVSVRGAGNNKKNTIHGMRMPCFVYTYIGIVILIFVIIMLELYFCVLFFLLRKMASYFDENIIEKIVCETKPHTEWK